MSILRRWMRFGTVLRETSNAQRPTPNSQLLNWTLNVERWALSARHGGARPGRRRVCFRFCFDDIPHPDDAPDQFPARALRLGGAAHVALHFNAAPAQ